MTCFTLEATDGAARAGVVHTAHGDIPTPAFMPVGTKATVKTLHPDEVRQMGASIILGNTYHLHFRPGEDVIEELGGLHAFSGWDGPILTDSGGFQVFSLRDTLLAVDDDGVTFRSVYDGAPGAVHARERRRDPAAPRLGHRDVPRHLPAGRLVARRARGCGAAHAPLGRAADRRTPGAGAAAVRDRAGRNRPGATAPLDRGDRGARVRRQRARGPRRGGEPGRDARDGRRGQRRSCPPRSRATSWASATPRASSA